MWGIRRGHGCTSCCWRFIPTYVGHTVGLFHSLFEVRFIPTYVGHTTVIVQSINCPSVHPHIRGAYSTGKIFSASAHGSSPHTWGIRTWQNWELGITPVHPHIRGAYIGQGRCGRSSGGSSPHTWGIRDIAEQVLAEARFIPTYVGYTS